MPRSYSWLFVTQPKRDSRDPDRGFRRFAGRNFDGVLAELASPPSGLAQQEAERRFATDGPNDLAARASSSMLTVLLRQFASPLVGILVFAALVSMAAREWTDAGVVLGIVFISALLSFVQEWRAERAVAELRSRVAPRASVKRDDAWESLPVSTLVVGDRVRLRGGSLVPADALVLTSRDLMVDEASLTGETFAVEKRTETFQRDTPLIGCCGVVFAGTTVRSGEAEVLVVGTGGASQLGLVAARLGSRAPETDFEQGVRRFGIMLSKVMFTLVGAVFVLNVVTDKPPIDSLLFAIAIAVGMAPEMLPAVITITLSNGARAMAAKGVIVRRLSAIENLGSMDVLCTDKTGTLTSGVVELENVLGPDGLDSERALSLAFANSSLESGLANALDDALVAFGKARGLTVSGLSKVDEVPYDFVRKRLGVVFDRDGVRTLIVKGAFKNVLSASAFIQEAGGAVALDDSRRADLTERADRLASEGRRVLGVASRAIGLKPTYSRDDEVEMVFEGFLAFSDPPKPDIDRVLESLRTLGITVKVVTGDSRVAAAHLVSRVGLDGAAILTSTEIGALSDAALPLVAQRTTVFAEVDPNQKERIISALRRAGHCVGYMGDGINDAPALHAADVGISVEGAVDVAKESADFVLMRPDLDVLSAGVEEGRRTFANTLKYVYTTTSANFGNMLSMAAASAFLPFLPLLAKQVLLNNFLSDIPAMTIATDGVDPESVERPRRWNINEIRRFMVAFGVTSSFFDLLTFAYLVWVVRATPEAFRTGWFIESLLTELVIVFVVRTRRSITRSRASSALLWSSVVVAVATMILPFTPIAPAFGLIPMPASVLVPLVGITVLYAVCSELVKRRLWGATASPA